jgi:hypothetical protein
VPVIGDMMPTRWAYEALIVNQFKNNDYQKDLFWLEQEQSELAYHLFIQIPQLINIVRGIHANETNKESENNDIELVYNELLKLSKFSLFESVNEINPNDYTKETQNKLLLYLNKLQQALHKKYNDMLSSLDQHLIQKQNETGNIQSFNTFRNKNYNNSIAELVMNSNEIEVVKRYGNELIQINDLIYKIPENQFGRSHLFAPLKRIGSIYITTIIFNNLVTVLMIIVVLLFLFNNKKPFIISR